MAWNLALFFARGLGNGQPILDAQTGNLLKIAQVGGK